MARSVPGVHCLATPLENGAAVRIALSEATLDYEAADALKAPLAATVRSYLDEGCRAYVLDLEVVERIDSGGVAILIAMHHQVIAAGGSLVVVTGKPFVRRALRLMRLDRLITVATDLERAVRELVDVD
jgi:anti-anti-sigma factor